MNIPHTLMKRLALVALMGCFCACRPTFTEMVEMRDGVRLATDVYLPKGDGPWPVVFHRTTYGRSSIQYAPAYVVSGVVVVSQDMRGHGDSEQTGIQGLQNHGNDGFDTISWLNKQSWCNGRIGTIGGSAAGLAQYSIAPEAPPGLVAMTPAAATPAMYNHVLFLGGAFRKSLVEGWVGRWGDKTMLEVLSEHPYNDGYWQSVQSINRFGDVHVPALHIAGWYDLFLQGTIDAFTGYQYQGGAGARGTQKLIIGPWSHFAFSKTTQGELGYPANAESAPFKDAFVVFLNDYLEAGVADIKQTADDIPTIQYYVMGDVDDSTAPGNHWRTASEWPPTAAPRRIYLHADGSLSESCPQGGITSYVFDPNNPSPTVGGNNLRLKSGPYDQRVVEGRDDVVVFETQELTEPMEITGRLYAHLFVSIDQPDADVMVRMTDVYPDGRSMLISDGAHRLATRGLDTGITPLQPGEIVEALVDLWSTSIIINRGHKLRISITSSNYPKFGVNQNNGLDYPKSIDGSGNPVAVTILHQKGYESFLELPDPNRDPQDYLACENRR